MKKLTQIWKCLEGVVFWCPATRDTFCVNQLLWCSLSFLYRSAHYKWKSATYQLFKTSSVIPFHKRLQHGFVSSITVSKYNFWMNYPFKTTLKRTSKEDRAGVFKWWGLLFACTNTTEVIKLGTGWFVSLDIKGFEAPEATATDFNEKYSIRRVLVNPKAKMTSCRSDFPNQPHIFKP